MSHTDLLGNDPEIHVAHDATGYPCFYVHGLAGDQKRDDAALDAMVHLFEAAPAMLALCRQLENWLRPEVVKEPDRTYFWKLVEVIRKAEGKEPLFTTHRSDEEQSNAR